MSGRTTYFNSAVGTLWKGFNRGFAMALSLAIVACGGGYSGGTTPAQNFGPTATTVAVGTITGFGSVHLNGLKFETTSATIKIDGASGVQDDLHVGEVIEVKGHHDAASGKDIADEIEFHANIKGPVGAVDAAAGTLVVLGQSVTVSADTSFDDSITPASLAGIQVGDILEISGMPAADGTLHATRIEKEPAGTTFQVIGTAASTDATAKTLKINALVVDFSAATLVDFPATGPKDGDLVEASGTTVDSAGVLQATRLELRTGKEIKPDADAKLEVEGLITRFVSATDFDVAGRPVTTSSSTVFEGGTANDLALNVRVEAEGAVDASGVLSATKIQIGHPAEDRMSGMVDAVDATAGTVKILGTTVSVDAMTRFEDHTAAHIQTFSLANVQAGDWLEIRGVTSATGDSVKASRVDRLKAQSGVRLSGPVATVADPNFTILATTVATTSATKFNHGLDAATFFATAVGKTVSVKGSWNGTVLAADEVQSGDGGEDGED